MYDLRMNELTLIGQNGTDCGIQHATWYSSRSYRVDITLEHKYLVAGMNRIYELRTYI